MNTPPIQGGYLKGRALIFPIALVTSLFFLWGFSYGLLDVLNKHFQDVLKISKLQSTGLQVMYFGGGYLCFSPVAAEVLRRKGYKFTILMGLSLYSLGAVMFWPVAHYTTPDNRLPAFGGFLVCTLVMCVTTVPPPLHGAWLTMMQRVWIEHPRNIGQLVRCSDRRPCNSIASPSILPVLERCCVFRKLSQVIQHQQ